jgi:hypothetical protein
MKEVALPDYRAIEGNRGAWCLHQETDGIVTVIMLTFWDDMGAIAKFAGEEVDKAKYYDFDSDYLIAFPERVDHLEIMA